MIYFQIFTTFRYKSLKNSDISFRQFQPDFSSFPIHQDIAIPDKHNFIYVFSP